LINAIFRGFHTIKGGAGFLNMTDLINVCHAAENMFDLIRSGKKTITPELMDVILRVFDATRTIFDAIHDGEQTSPADPVLCKSFMIL
jgi:two-component system chemotaxis sensor kinase CheA